jgi:hypothetical protein
VQTKEEAPEKGKRKLQSARGAETATALLAAKTVHHKSALKEDDSEWTGLNRLFSADEIIRLDEPDRSENNNTVCGLSIAEPFSHTSSECQSNDHSSHCRMISSCDTREVGSCLLAAWCLLHDLTERNVHKMHRRVVLV